MKHLHSGPGNEGVFLRNDSEEVDQRETWREVKQREYIRSGDGNYTADLQTSFLAVKVASDCDTLWPKDCAYIHPTV